MVFAVAALVSFGFWSFPANADPPSKKKIVDVREMSVKERADLGERLIFGSVGTSGTELEVGKAQCPLCHGFFKGSKMADPNEYPSPPYGPHFFNHFTERIERLVASPQYKQRPRNTVQPEAFPGSGIATSLIEYLAESNVCPSCYVVPGFGVRDTHDHESPMPAIHKAPIGLTIDELIAVDTWLYVHDCKEPPSPQEIENAYRKFVPASEWFMASRDPEIYPASESPGPVIQSDGPLELTGQEPLDELFTKALCFACHTIPGFRGAVGVVGPELAMKTTALKRLKDPRYKGKASNVREYIIESILDPSAYVVEGYPDNVMPHDYSKKLTEPVIDKMADYLSQLEEGKEPLKKAQ
jgi:hypothetical protein